MKNEKLVKEHGDNHHYQQDKKIDRSGIFKQIGNHTILSIEVQKLNNLSF